MSEREIWRPEGVKWMTGREWIRQGKEMRSWDEKSIARRQRRILEQYRKGEPERSPITSSPTSQSAPR